MFGKIVADFVGVVSYRISRDKPNAFLATYFSTRTEDRALGTGFAHGDTSKGFCGVHEIIYYEPNGQPSGGGRTYELTVTAQGEMREMVWTRDGKVVYLGIGIETDDQLIATYWKPSEQSA